MSTQVGTDLKKVPFQNIWQGGPSSLVCTGVRDETSDVKTFFLRPSTASSFSYLPGQWISIGIAGEAAPLERIYTLSSSPSRPDLASITVKRQSQGLMSSHLHKTLRPGMFLNASAPGGDFSFVHAPHDRYVFLSGGSGITPLMSMSRYICDLRLDHDVLFIHSARSPEDIIFRNEIDFLSRQHPHFEVRYLCDKMDEQRAWSGLTGYVNTDVLHRLVPDLEQREVFCCGPTAYMAKIRDILAALGHPIERYHEESFGVSGPPPQQENPSNHQQTFSVSFPKISKTISCSTDQTLLSAIRNAGIPISFSCQKGICGACRTKKISGSVDMLHQGGIRPKDIEKGFILPCCSRPLSHVALEMSC
ncbi:MAG: hybrid-cluster NAD(P)-dependent oxidoreductase [Oligoflexales bacterium]|nr:hybrid-cluster NAD(P)-dependent oxidoreductase [Oligoflexales bacterium]